MMSLSTALRRVQFVAGALAVFLALGAAGGATNVSATQEPLPAAPDVVQRHVNALGGVDAFKRIRSLRARGRVEIAGAGLTGDFELVAARPNRAIYRLTIPVIGAMEQGFDGTTGWTLNPLAGPEVLSGRELAEAADDAWFDHALYEADYVQSLETIGRVDFDGRPTVKLRVVLRSGTEQMEYFDLASGLAAGSDANRATSQGIVPSTTILRNYRRYGDVLHPTVLVQRALGMEQVVTLADLEVDGVPDTAFVLPPVVAALIAK